MSKTSTRERCVNLRPWEARAFADGRATRILRPILLRNFMPATTPGYAWEFRDRRELRNSIRDDAELVHNWCPYGKPGDLLIGMETWADAMSDAGPCICYRSNLDRRYLDDPWPVDYERYPGCRFANWAADLERGIEGHWRSAATMPRWAARFHWEVAGVRTVRVQEVTEIEAAELGVEWHRGPRRAAPTIREQWDADHRRKPGLAWVSNPWCWMVEVRRVER